MWPNTKKGWEACLVVLKAGRDWVSALQGNQTHVSSSWLNGRQLPEKVSGETVFKRHYVEMGLWFGMVGWLLCVEIGEQIGSML